RVALWNKANWSEFEFFLQNIAWESYFENSTDSESYWQAFSNILTFGIDKFVPHKIVNIDQEHKKPQRKKRHCKRIKKLLSRKLTLWRKYKKYKSNKCKSKYLKIAKLCKSELDRSEYEKESEILNSSNLGTFYKF